MTREHKLALILGFALVLIVGVLISDHMSGARQTTIESIALDDGVSPPLLGPGGLIPSPQIARADPPVDAIAPTPEPPPQQSARPQTQREPVTLTMNPAGGDDQQFAGNANGPRISTDELIRYARDRFNVDLTSVTPVVGMTTNGPAGSAQPQPASQQPRAYSYPEPALHIVVQGDSLWSLAQRYYADGALHERLAAYNASRLRDPSAMHVGLNLLIPTKAELLGVAPPATREAPRAATPAATAPPSARTPASPGRTYTVQRGDTLGDISMSQLGTSRRWREIYELNRDRIKDPDRVPAGTALRIPAR